MNDTVVARPCWTVLTKKAEDRIAIIGIKEQLIAQERERIKMQTLADQNAQAVQREENKKDQRRMDALGVMQFNLKPQS